MKQSIASLVGQGAESFASQEGFERKNMLTDRAKIHYKNRIKEEQSKLDHILVMIQLGWFV